MDLKPLGKEDNNYEITLETEPHSVKTNEVAKLSIAIKSDGHVVPLDVLHEMKMHLLIVNEELSWFSHIHPEEQEDGTYLVSEKFPTAGKYLLFTDYKPMGSEGNVDMKSINVDGTGVQEIWRFRINILQKRMALLSGY